jgi:hypothetical protein
VHLKRPDVKLLKVDEDYLSPSHCTLITLDDFNLQLTAFDNCHLSVYDSCLKAVICYFAGI